MSGVLYPDVRVTLSGTDGNAFGILARVRKALTEKHGKEVGQKFRDEATTGDYDHLLATCMKYVEID
jgi:hypothetical protein